MPVADPSPAIAGRRPACYFWKPPRTPRWTSQTAEIVADSEKKKKIPQKLREPYIFDPYPRKNVQLSSSPRTENRAGIVLLENF